MVSYIVFLSSGTSCCELTVRARACAVCASERARVPLCVCVCVPLFSGLCSVSQAGSVAVVARQLPADTSTEEKLRSNLAVSVSLSVTEAASSPPSSSWRIKANLRFPSTIHNLPSAGQLPGSPTSCRKS